MFEEGEEDLVEEDQFRRALRKIRAGCQDTKVNSGKGLLHLSKAQVQELTNALRGSNVTNFNLAACGVSDEAAMHVAEILKEAPCLTALDLCNNEMEDGGARALAEALQDSTLSTPRLGFNLSP